ncbi:hypothetical protein BGZ83_007379 [Gryganskiella cystojenkinii]|nr:hypothetical protein BGZ83_007379 [Gryganskiella cystojenkinii]
MTELYSGTIDMTSVAATLASEESEINNNENSNSASEAATAGTSSSSSTTSESIPQRQTLSSKRMRPPLAEISIASPSFPSLSTSKVSTNRPDLIMHSKNGSSFNGKIISHNSNVKYQSSITTAAAALSSALNLSIDTNCNISSVSDNSNNNNNNNNSSSSSNDTPFNNNNTKERAEGLRSVAAAIARRASDPDDILYYPPTTVAEPSFSTEPKSSPATLTATYSSTPAIPPSAATIPQHHHSSSAPRTMKSGGVGLSRDAKKIRDRLRNLWWDPSRPKDQYSQARRDPKNQYVRLGEALAGILQIVPPIIQNARSSTAGLGLLSHPHHRHSPSNVVEILQEPRPAAPYSPSIAQATEASAGTFPALSPFSSPTAASTSLSFPPTTSGGGNAVGGSDLRANDTNSGGGGSEGKRNSSGSGGSMLSSPVRTRARTTSSNSNTTISATRYQIATSILQPPEPPLMDVNQPSVIRPLKGAMLGEPALSTILASSSSSFSTLSQQDSSFLPSFSASNNNSRPESHEILTGKLLSLARTMTGAIKTLCEQQNEKVLRFDDDMIMQLLLQWEQEAGGGNENDVDDEDGAEDAAMTSPLGLLPNNGSTTSLVSLGATNALERYQLLVGRVWEETNVILVNIRKVRDLVEFGTVQHYHEFDDADSEEDAAERDEQIKNNLYPALLSHANGLVTVLGELLECVSGILRLVGTIKQRRSMDAGNSITTSSGTRELGSPLSPDSELLSGGRRYDYPAPGQSSLITGFMSEEPRPIKHLDPAMMKKLKRKTPRFKSIADKVRKTVSEFTKKSTHSVLNFLPPLGDGTNEGFHWDSYSDGDYESEEWIASEMVSSNWGEQSSASYNSTSSYNFRTFSPPSSPSHLNRSPDYNYGPAGPTGAGGQGRGHRRLSSKDSSTVAAGLRDQYWPGSTRLGLSDDSSPGPISPFNNAAGYFSQAAGGAGTQPDMTTLIAPTSAVDPISFTSNRKSLESSRECRLSSLASSLPETTSYSPPMRSPKSDDSGRRTSIFGRRGSQQTQAFTGTSISSPIPTISRPFSVHSSGSESHTTPSKNNYRARPPKPPGALSPMPPSPTHSYFKADELMNETSSFREGALERSGSYLATRSLSPLQSAPLILDSPFTRQTSIRMGTDRNRYSIRMPADEIAIGPLEPSSSSMDATSPDSHGGSSTSFWRRKSFSDAADKNWQSLRHQSMVSERSLSSSIRMTTFDFQIPFFSRANSSVSQKSLASRRSRPLSASAAGIFMTSIDAAGLSGASPAMSTSSRPRMSDFGNNRRHSSPLLAASDERILSEALSPQSQNTSRRQSIVSQHSMQSHSSTNRSSVHMMPIVDEDSQQQQQQLQSMSSPSLSSSPHSTRTGELPRPLDALVGSDLEILKIAPRPRLIQQQSYQETSRRNGKDVVLPELGPRDTATAEDDRTVEVKRRPISSSRFGDMRKAWEILNLDVKRLNQYSDLRVYAKTNNAQINQWALNHPNALKSVSSPQVLNIGENGIDVLVMEIAGDYLQVVAGLLEKLIERLADENAQDGEYVSTFLLSHSFFIDSEDLLDRLMARFHIQPRQGEILYFEKWQTVIQVKILCVFNRWIQIQYEDFELNPILLKTLRRFLEVDVRSAGFAMEAEYIERKISIRALSPLKNCSVIMEQSRFCLQRSRTRKLSLSRSQNRSPGPGQQPLSPAAMMTSSLDPIPPSPVEHAIEYGPTPELESDSPIRDLDAQDLARYLTVADMRAFRGITVFELMTGWWKRRRAMENMKEAAEPNASGGVDVDSDGAIEAFTRRANMLSYWVAHEIVSCKRTKHRREVIKKFIDVAMKCRELNNLHTTMFIVSALTSKPVTRLKKTWKSMDKDKEILSELEKLLDPSSNMRHYRQAIAAASAPAIPFLPILLKDITFILDGNPTMIASQASVKPAFTSADGTAASVAVGASTSASAPNSSSGAGTRTTGGSGSPKPERAMLVNFDKFRRLTQYVENVVDMAKSVDYWFETQLLRQARVFRPSSPSNVSGGMNDNDSQHGSIHSISFRRLNKNDTGGTSSNISFGQSSNISGSTPIGGASRGVLDNISEIVERRLVKASGLYGAHQRVIEVEFSTKPKQSTSIWKTGMQAASGGGGGSTGGGGGYGGSGGASASGSVIGQYGQQGETVIRAVQGEEEYLMGLSILCESY